MVILLQMINREVINTKIKDEFSKYLSNLTLDDFIILNLKGKGAYGSVLIVKEVKTNIVYYMRIINKNDLTVYNDRLLLKGNRPFLELIDFPLITTLSLAFHSKQKLYLLGKYEKETIALSEIEKKGFKEEDVKFLTAQLVVSIEHLHSKNVIYRQ